MNYWVISAVILVLGVASGVAYRRGYVRLFVGLMALEVEARKARARQRAKDERAD